MSAPEEPVEALSAVTLVVSDMIDSVAFYRSLGLRLTYGGPTSSFTSFAAGGGFVNLQLGTTARGHQPLWGRVVLWVRDVDAMYRRCFEAGYTPETRPADAPWGERYFHIRDPDGHELSFARPLRGR